MDEAILWAVKTNSDLTEGRGREYVAHFCRTLATANRLAKGAYVQGSDAPVVPVKLLILDGVHVLPSSIIKIEEPAEEDKHQQAQLDKFNAAVFKAKDLGLSDEDIATLRSFL
jgi:hypothetical protein